MKRIFQVGKGLLTCCLVVTYGSITVFAKSYTEVGSKSLISMLGRGVPLIDIRTEEEWHNTGVIEGSKMMTAFNQNGKVIKGFIQRFRNLVGRNDEVILICHSGGRTSFLARVLSEQLKYKNVFNAHGGIVRWVREGRPLVLPNQ